MRFAIDHDLHIHSLLSSCSRDDKQTADAILAYGKQNGMRHLCLTDHFWDETVPGASSWYQPQNLAHIRASLPLPQDEGIAFHFGCETDMDRFCTLGIDRATFNAFDFVIIPINHLHMKGFTIDPAMRSAAQRADVMLEHYRALLDKDLPFEKIGIAHLTTHLIASNADCTYTEVLDALDTDALCELFTRTASLGAGIELNVSIDSLKEESVLRIYRLAKDCGCRFYLGSDAHHPSALDGAINRFHAVIDALNLTEDAKFLPFS